MARLLSFSPHESLDLVRPFLAAELVKPSQIAAIGDFLIGAPRAFQWSVLEIRPLGDQPVDFLGCMIALPGEKERIRKARARAPWRPIESRATLLDAWCDESPELEGMNVIWFEWDAPFSRKTPLILPSVEPTFWGSKSARRPSPEALVRRVAEFERLEHGVVTSPGLSLVKCVLDRLETRGRALSIASLRGRGDSGYRVFVEIRPSTLLDWLREIEWPGDSELVLDWLPRIVMPWEQAYVQIEVGTRVRDYLGIEPQQTKGSLSQLSDRGRTLQAASAAGRVDRLKIECVLDWMGRSKVVHEGVDAELVRSLHLKFVFRSRELEGLKAYLGWCLEPSYPNGEL